MMKGRGHWMYFSSSSGLASRDRGMNVAATLMDEVIQSQRPLSAHLRRAYGIPRAFESRMTK